MKHHAEHAAHELRLLTQPATWLCAVVGALAIGTAHAANSPDNLSVPSDAASMSPAEAFQHDKEYCNSREVTEARTLCLKEASRAYAEARAGRLETSTSGTSSAGTGTHKHRARHHKSSKTASADTTTTTTTTTTSGDSTKQAAPSGK